MDVRGRRPIPARVDETYAAPLPVACPRCGGAIQATRVATQYQEDLPVVQPIVRRFNIQIGCCVACRHRVQGRHPLQTSDALGAAGVQLGPGAVTFTVLLHKHVGVPLEKIATLLQDRFGLTVTPGGLAQVLHRAARVAAPTYAALCAQIGGVPSSVRMKPAGASVPCCTGCGRSRHLRPPCMRSAPGVALTMRSRSWARTSPVCGPRRMGRPIAASPARCTRAA